LDKEEHQAAKAALDLLHVLIRKSAELSMFMASDMELYCRLTLIIRNGIIVHTFYPIFLPDAHAGDVVEWLAKNPA